MDSMYFVAVVLPKELDEKVLEYKKFMQERYGCKVGLKSPAHITLVAPFWMGDEKEYGLKNDLHVLASHTQPFLIRTNNFSAFKPRTLFVAVQENSALNTLKKLVDAHFGASDYKIKKKHGPFIRTLPLPPAICTKKILQRHGCILKTKTLKKASEQKDCRC
jgi:2'-5' RNA ligase